MTYWVRPAYPVLILIAGLSAIVGVGIWYQFPASNGIKMAICLFWGLMSLAVMVGEFIKSRFWSRLFFVAVILIFFSWWMSIKPSNTRIWADDVARTVTGTVSNNTAILHNIRNFTWHDLDNYEQKWETRTYDLSKITSVDLFLSTWGNPDIAHTLVSFGFLDGGYVVFSVEIRKEKGEEFSEIAGFFKQYEIALIAADENDIIRTRTNIRKENVSRYRVLLTPDQARDLFVSYIERGNRLAANPAFYNTLTANCTTVVFDMIRLIIPEIPVDRRILLSGRLPSYIYDLGGLGQEQTLADLSATALISPHAQAIGEQDDFSSFIRELPKDKEK